MSFPKKAGGLEVRRAKERKIPRREAKSEGLTTGKTARARMGSLPVGRKKIRNHLYCDGPNLGS